MELIEARNIKHWDISPLGVPGEKPMGFMMKFYTHMNTESRMVVTVDECEQMYEALGKAIALRHEILKEPVEGKT